MGGRKKRKIEKMRMRLRNNARSPLHTGAHIADNLALEINRIGKDGALVRSRARQIRQHVLLLRQQRVVVEVFC